MIEIDFLPIQYHQKNAYRQAKPWRIIVVSAFLCLVVIITISQAFHRRYLESEFNELGSAYEMAATQKQRYSDAQNQLKRLESEAELIAYLRHPWPRSQLIAALLSRLPDEITLEQLQITLQDGSITSPSNRRSTTASGDSDNQKSVLSPGERDLQYLSSRSEGKQTVVILTGSTTDSAAVHRFLNEILANTLFAKTELGFITSVNESSGTATQFQAKLIVRPGYGRPGGPGDNQKMSRLLDNAGDNYANKR
jgi:hypothetical protein